MIGYQNHHLPIPRTSLFGRERDVAEIRSLLLHDPERLVTLTGVGGCGKTRLAIEVASGLRDAFPDGVWLVELAPLSDPQLVPETMAAALGIQDGPDQGSVDTLMAHLQSRTLAIVLDNCEHLIHACATLVDSLLSTCPTLRILATSREPFQIAGEKQRRVFPLFVPDPGQPITLDELARCPAVQLFVDRASAVEPCFQLTPNNASTVARICAVLGGIPLALELAAARVRVLSVEQLAQRLGDGFSLLAGSNRCAPTRQQTLKATLDWSYNLLSADEQSAFRRLAVFAGGWSLEAAEEVCAEDRLQGVEVLDVLTRLVDKSLVVVEELGGEARYRLLEPVRQYGQHLLAASGEVEVAQARVTAFCIALAEQAEPELQGQRQAEWLRRLDREFDNIRAALRWAEERNDAETSLRVAGPLGWYFWMRRHLREGLRWLESALARDIVVPVEVRAKALSAASLVCSFLSEYSKGLEFGREALTLYRQVRDAEGLSWPTITLSHIHLAKGDLVTSRSLAEEGLACAREAGSNWRIGHALVLLGEIARQQGENVQAVALHQEALAAFREHGEEWGIGFAALALESLEQDRLDLQRPAAQSSVRLYWAQQDYLSLAGALEYLAGRGEVGHPEAQVRLFAAAHSLRQSLGAPPLIGERDVERSLAAARSSLGETRFAAIWSEGCAMSLEQVVQSALGERRSNPEPKPTSSPRRPPGPSDVLTRREREVSLLVAHGYTDRQIAEELTIAEGTAGLHVHHILEKLGFRSRFQILDWALVQGLIEQQPN